MTRETGPRVRTIPEGEDRERLVCPDCGYIAYQNPLVVVGSVAVAEDGRILLCRRAIEPCRGLWTLPAGFMEEHETSAEGAHLLAERFRAIVEANPFDLDPESIKVTISLGVAPFISGDDGKALISRADRALYQAKHSGRNCVRKLDL